jgi:NADH:ubiquinone oxidoreductase subunit K
MSNQEIFSWYGIVGIMVLIVGFYSVLVTNNLIRTLIGLEVLTKSVTLMIIVTGYMTRQMALAQELAITLIIIEVAVMEVAVGVVLCIFRHDRSIDAGIVRNLKG